MDKDGRELQGTRSQPGTRPACKPGTASAPLGAVEGFGLGFGFPRWAGWGGNGLPSLMSDVTPLIGWVIVRMTQDHSLELRLALPLAVSTVRTADLRPACDYSASPALGPPWGPRKPVALQK